MEDQLLVILSDTLSSAEAPRKLAELQLQQATTQPAYPGSLAAIGCHANIAIEVRQSALLALRTFVEKNWSGFDENGLTITIEEGVKEQLRGSLLGLATSVDQDRKLRTLARCATLGLPQHVKGLR